MLLTRLATAMLVLVSLAGCAEAAPGPEDIIRSKLAAVLPTAKVTSIKPSALPNFYEVKAAGFEPVYVSADGRFMLQGELLEIRGNDIVSLSAEASMGEHKAALAQVKREDMIIFKAAGEKPKAAIYVFTDVDCGYCRKLHTEVPALNKMGVEVRYLAFPRTGLKGPTATTMEKIWCAADRNTALTEAKQGAKLDKLSPGNCKSLVQAQYQLGGRLDVTGTPAIFLEDGRQVGGYLPAAELAKRLKLK